MMLEEALTNLKPALQSLRHQLQTDDGRDEGGSGIPAHPKPPIRPVREARARPTFIDDPAG